jgi:hypothetical protein
MTEKKTKNEKATHPSIAEQIQLTLQQNEELINGQVKKIMVQYFTEERSADGKPVFKPAMHKIIMENKILTPSSTDSGKTEITTTEVEVSVPLITLASLSFMAITECNIDSTGKLEVKLGQVPIPDGLNLLIDSLTKTITPIIAN